MRIKPLPIRISYLKILAILTLAALFFGTQYRVIRQYAQKFDNRDYTTIVSGGYTYQNQAGNFLFPHGSINHELIVVGLVGEFNLDTLIFQGDCAALFEKYKSYDLLERMLERECVILYNDNDFPDSHLPQNSPVAIENRDNPTRLVVSQKGPALHFRVM